MIPNYFWLKAILPSFIFQLIKFDCQELPLAGRVTPWEHLTPWGVTLSLRNGMWNNGLTPNPMEKING